ncbi:MAG TPA: hypothetical protein VJ951_12300 [Bacteroidales bacterium]|nr:hypothetical protein [Bacteroidales bacterium]
MRKLLLSIAAIFCFSSLSNAQEIEVGLNLGLGIPVGDIGEAYGSGFAWNINGYYGISDKLSAGLEIGSTTFNSSINSPFGGFDIDFSLTEFIAVGRYKFYDKEKLSLGAGMGLGLYSNSGSELGISPRVYGSYMLTDEIGLTANIPFHLLLTEGSLNYMQIRVGGFYLLSL